MYFILKFQYLPPSPLPLRLACSSSTHNPLDSKQLKHWMEPDCHRLTKEVKKFNIFVLPDMLLFCKLNIQSFQGNCEYFILCGACFCKKKKTFKEFVFMHRTLLLLKCVKSFMSDKYTHLHSICINKTWSRSSWWLYSNILVWSDLNY